MAGFFNEKKNFGFGCMRLPVHDGAIDTGEFSRMSTRFWRRGSTISTPRTGTWTGRARAR